MALPKFGTGMGLFDGNEDYLSIPASSDFNYGTSDYTIECFFRLNAITSDFAIYEHYSSSSAGLMIRYQGSTQLISLQNWGNTDGTIITAEGIISDTDWHHIAIVRFSGTVTIYLDGTSIGTSSSITHTGSPSSSLYISRDWNAAGDYNLNGNIDEYRVSQVARYTSNFTPPTSAFTNDANTKLLLHMDGTDGSTTFIDSSSSSHTITAVGNAQISTGVPEGLYVTNYGIEVDIVSTLTGSDYLLATNYGIEVDIAGVETPTKRLLATNYGIEVDIAGVETPTKGLLATNYGLQVDIETPAKELLATNYGLQVDIETPAKELLATNYGLQVDLGEPKFELLTTNYGLQVDINTMDSGLYVTSVGSQVDINSPNPELLVTNTGSQVDIGLDAGLRVTNIGSQVDVAVEPNLKITNVGSQVEVGTTVSELYMTNVGSQVEVGTTVPELYITNVGVQVDLAIPTRGLKYYNGSSWIEKPLKYYNGSNWVTKSLKYYNGSSWV
jgi:hypothetical protein